MPNAVTPNKYTTTMMRSTTWMRIILRVLQRESAPRVAQGYMPRTTSGLVIVHGSGFSRFRVLPVHGSLGSRFSLFKRAPVIAYAFCDALCARFRWRRHKNGMCADEFRGPGAG